MTTRNIPLMFNARRSSCQLTPSFSVTRRIAAAAATVCTIMLGMSVDRG